MAEPVTAGTMFRKETGPGQQTILGLGEVGSNAEKDSKISLGDNLPQQQTEAAPQAPPTPQPQATPKKQDDGYERRVPNEITNNGDQVQIKGIMQSGREYGSTFFDDADSDNDVAPEDTPEFASPGFGGPRTPSIDAPLGELVGDVVSMIYNLTPAGMIENVSGTTYEEFIDKNLFFTDASWNAIEASAKEAQSQEGLSAQERLAALPPGLQTPGMRQRLENSPGGTGPIISREDAIFGLSEIAKLGTDLTVFKYISVIGSQLGKMDTGDIMRLFASEKGSFNLEQLRKRADDFFKIDLKVNEISKANAQVFNGAASKLDSRQYFDNPGVAKIFNELAHNNPKMTGHEVARLTKQAIREQNAGLAVLESKITQEMNSVRAIEERLTGTTLHDTDLRNDAIDRIAHSFMSNDPSLRLGVPFTEKEIELMSKAGLYKRASTPLQLREDMQAVHAINNPPKALTDVNDLIKTEELGRFDQEGKRLDPTQEEITESVEKYVAENGTPDTDRLQSGSFSKISDAPNEFSGEGTLTSIDEGAEAAIIEGRASAGTVEGGTFGNIRQTEKALGRKLESVERKALKNKNPKIQEQMKAKLRAEFKKKEDVLRKAADSAVDKFNPDSPTFGG